MVPNALLHHSFFQPFFSQHQALVLFLVFALAWTALTWWCVDFFSDFERRFFSSADKECRAFLSESYSNPPSDLGEFNGPLSYGVRRSVAAWTYASGLLALFFFGFFSASTAHPFELFSLLGALFFAQRLAWFDQKHLYLPDGDVAAFGFFSLALATLLHTPETWKEVALSGLALVAFLWVLTTVFRALRGKEGLGMGDVKLLLAMVPLLGFAALSHVLLMASFLGVFWWAWQRLMKHKLSTQFPFGPFLLSAWSISVVHLRHPFLPW